MFVTMPEIPESLSLQGEQHCVLDLVILVNLLDILLNFGSPIGVLQCPFLFGIPEHGQYHLGLLSVRSSAFDSLLGIRSPVRMRGLQSSANSLLVPIFHCTALTMKKGMARSDGTSVGVIGFDHNLLIRLHILCFLLGVIVEVRGFLCQMISIWTSCNGMEGGPFRFRPPAIFLAKNLSALHVIPWPWGLWLLWADDGPLAILPELGQHSSLLGTGVLVSEGSIQVIFCFFLGAMSGR